MTKPCVRLLLVDNHQVVRIGLATLFRTVGHFLVVREAGTLTEAVAQARHCTPDVVLMDVRLPDGSGIEACRQIRAERPDARVLMLTSSAAFPSRTVALGFRACPLFQYRAGRG